MKNILYFTPIRRVSVAITKYLKWIPDSVYLRILYMLRMQRILHLNKPVTYNEKLQWLKINDRKPEYSDYVDKYLVKRIVADKLESNEYVIPTLAVWNSIEEIDIESLPNKFVIKCTHDSGGLVICKDKSKLDIEAMKEKLQRCLKKNYYYQNREWPYKNVVPRIIAEPYIEEHQYGELKDFKFFCFDGEVRALFVASDRPDDTKFDYFDSDFNRLEVRQHYPNSNYDIKKPECFEEMKKIAETLSRGIKHVRIDLYDVDGKPMFGEMTFFHFSGMERFFPDEYDYLWGEYIDINGSK